MIKIINLYDSKETNFNNNGLVVLDSCKSCLITEENNGQYELELEYPLDPRGKWQYLLEGNIIKADGQLFRIYHKTKALTGIKVNARHIFYDLLDNLVEEVDIRGLSGASALDRTMTNTAYPHNFQYMSDITDVNNLYIDDEDGDIINKNPVESIFFLIDLYGGELVRDNFYIKWLKQRGQDRGALISYGKNIKGIEEDINLDNVITRIKPIGQDGLTLDEVYVDSQYINNYPNPKIKTIEFNDCNDYESLRDAAKKYYKDTNCDTPVVNYKVDFIELSKTEEYKNYKVLERVYVGDTVTVKHKKLNISLKCKVIKIKKDAITGRILEVELGNFKSNIANSISDISNNIETTNKAVKETKSSLQKAIDNATTEINSALGGYVLKRENELLIMDTQDVMTAVKIWKWGLGGLGFSENGINGPFRTAITASGSIVADFVNAGTLDGALIKAGSIKANSLEINAQQDLENGGLAKAWIDAHAGNIALVVSEDGKIKGDNIVSAINMSSSKIEMKALNLDLSGYVTFNSLSEPGETVIDGANIKTGKISADRIDVQNLKVYAANILGSISFNDLSDKPNARDIGAIPDTYINSSGIWTGKVYAQNITGGYINSKHIDVDEISTQITKVSDFINFEHSTYINGIGTMKSSSNYPGYLGLVSYQGIYASTDNFYLPSGKVATREWVREQSLGDVDLSDIEVDIDNLKSDVGSLEKDVNNLFGRVAILEALMK